LTYSKKTSPIALAVAGVILFGAVTMTAAAPEKKGQKKGGAPATSKALIAQGKKVFESAGCMACHTIGDKGGKMGPALTHIGKDKEWTPAKLAAMIRDPKKGKPSAKMPAFPPDKISDKDLKALVAYLESLK